MSEHKQLNLTIARVDVPVFSGLVVSVTLPGSEGEMTLLADHAPFMTALRSGVITVRKEGGENEIFTVTSGTVEVSNNTVTILL